MTKYCSKDSLEIYKYMHNTLRDEVMYRDKDMIIY